VLFIEYTVGVQSNWLMVLAKRKIIFRVSGLT